MHFAQYLQFEFTKLTPNPVEERENSWNMSAETPKCAHNLTTSTINWFRIGLVCHRVVEMKYTGVRTQERTSKTMHFEC